MSFMRLLLAATIWLSLVCAGPAMAQLHLPQLPLQVPTIPPTPGLSSTTTAVTRRVESALDPRNLLELRRLTIRELLRKHRDVIEADPAGDPIVRSEVVVLSPSPAALDAARAADFAVARERMLDGLDERVVVLRAPPGLATEAALRRLRALDPQGLYDFNHLYFGTGTVRAAAADTQRPAWHVAMAETRARGARPRIGLIDGGLDLRHPALRDADIHPFGCAGELVPSVHGTAVASLLVGRAQGFTGAAPAGVLYAADVYCDQPTGGAAALLIEALAWMAREQVPVVNISLVGPDNRTLERVVRALIARGHIVVAAVGNDGPAAPPLYPAAYSGVIGVTAVDAERRVLPEAVRGPQVVFAAPGADMAVAANGGRGFSRARGTSFAAPLVAGLLAVALSTAQDAVEALIRSAVDLGPPGRDATYGFGLVGEKLRVDPVALQ